MTNTANKSGTTDERSISGLLAMIKFGLENLIEPDRAGRRIRVNKLQVLNNTTLECRFSPNLSTSNDIKVEIATIMGFLGAFCRETPLTNFNSFAVRAFDSDSKEILYALSSEESAALIGAGRAIEWLKSTLFIENTDDYRVAIAKKTIFEIENGLRFTIVETLRNKYGSNWWDICLTNNVGKVVKNTYFNQFGINCIDGTVLINYTYTLDLKKIICTYWTDFKQFFSSKKRFESAIETLNQIRRDEAHNRVISEGQLESLKILREEILTIIARQYPARFSSYLVENWQLQVERIMNYKFLPPFSTEDIAGAGGTMTKMQMVISNTESLIHQIQDKIVRLKSVVTPPERKDIHDEIITKIENTLLLQIENLEFGKEGNIAGLENNLKRIEENSLTIADFVQRALAY